ISFDRYIRTTDKDHISQATDFYLRIKKTGDIYKSWFKGFYCSGCEEYKTESELDNHHCPYHPSLPIEELAEENYFFSWSKYQGFLKDHIKNNPDFVKPASRAREMISFLDQGLNDISISRSRQNIGWGIPVPDDSDQVLYVWFEALINYLTGAPKGFWPADLHLLGKDNTRFHALLWPAMLKSAGFPLPKTVYSHGFLTFNNQKISKSLGNIIRPKELVEKFGTDGARYLLATAKNLAGDGDISWKKMTQKYNSDLANGLGNLVARLSRLCQLSEQNFNGKCPQDFKLFKGEIGRLMKDYQVSTALDLIWKKIHTIDRNLDETKPWQIKDKSKLGDVLVDPVDQILTVAVLLTPFLPETARIISQVFSRKKIKPPEQLFIRKE
ncbi:MAG: methionine--tRNA ligase, partial [Candidatus Shapirobacteria bacterium]|nr:methionine--tRNA ligase [Candidatus Shapirobacteria bacterium]